MKKQRLTRRVSQTMGRQRNKPHVKGQEEASERMLNEIEASQLSDIGFKAMVIRKLNDVTEKYQKQQGNYNNLNANYIHTRKEGKLSTMAKMK